MKVSIQKAVRVSVDAEHRYGVCEKCGIQMTRVGGEDEETPVRLVCDKCGGSKGRLIAKSVSIQGPDPPACTRPSCIWEFFKDSLLSMLLSVYHARRVRYAEEKRHKKIPEKYRTGENAPTNIRGAILAIIKLKFRR